MVTNYQKKKEKKKYWEECDCLHRTAFESPLCLLQVAFKLHNVGIRAVGCSPPEPTQTRYPQNRQTPVEFESTFRLS